MIGEEDKYKMSDIPWGELSTFKQFPSGWILRGMEVGMAQNTAGHQTIVSYASLIVKCWLANNLASNISVSPGSTY
jgi:hypothetical protein